MDTKALEKFAQAARRQLTDQVTARLQLVLHGDSADLRARAEAVKDLREEIKATSREAVIERVAYTWFNRFCALRFMDANRYTPLGIVSPAPGNTQPEILQEAKAGQIDPIFPVDAPRVLDLLGERIPSPDPQQEAYRLLVVAACNYYHGIMPFMFEPIADYTELLMPDDLLSANSVLYALREAMTEDTCRDVEVIGWLYQFYISEKKDAVFAALKEGKKIAAQDIPAATQLFTPHWIVRFVVENSLGRLWLLNRPASKLVDSMPYYIQPEQQETDFVRVETPDELRICDPAVGSGHMLTYAFDLLYAIYEEEGYNPPDIPQLILHKNLYGIEIDERAGALAAFALTMKARSRDTRFLRRDVRPNVCVLQPVAFVEGEVEQASWVQAMGANLPELPLRDALLHDLEAYAQVGTVGSLLRPQLTLGQIAEVQASIRGADDLFSQDFNARALNVLAGLEYLAHRYHVVIANPPYMGGGGMNDELKRFLSRHYSETKSDLFSAFISRIIEMTVEGGMAGMMTPFNWMFLSSFEKLRRRILAENTLTTLVRPEFHALFDTAYVTVCGFTVFRRFQASYKGMFVDLEAFYGADLQPVKVMEAAKNLECGWLHRASAADFGQIPGSPLAYWVSERVRNIFSEAKLAIGDITISDGQTKTGDNDKYLRLIWEVARSDAGSPRKWWLHPKGGPFRRWYGNVDWLIDWSEEARLHYRHDRVARILPEYLWGRKGVSWTLITSGEVSFRILQETHIFNLAAPSLFFKDDSAIPICLAFLNTKFASKVLKVINPTMNMNVGEVQALPLLDAVHSIQDEVSSMVDKLVSLSKNDWDAYETSWDFANLPLLHLVPHTGTLATSYASLRNYWLAMILDMRRLEEENNRLFISLYGLQNELTPDVALEDITLICNPHYRYGGRRSETELERLLLADTIRELISYAVGCMFGRYSLDKPGLVLANQGETLADYLRQVPNPTFTPDKDNVIPILAGDWFPDDAAERFKRFLRVTFGDEHFAENLAFVENGIGRDIRSYFLREFYDHHLKMYQKRPIYWLFSSPKGSFNALIYMHRYRPDTVSVVLNDYLREFVAKLSARRAHLEQLRISAATPAADKTRALKEIDGIDKTLAELTAYENEILYPLATQQVKIDLDDGVKVNYAKFGKALRRIPGLSE